jgi:macrolide-specific efflux system membrane fusion protein
MQSAPTIVVIGSVARMAVRAEISEADISRVRPGLPVYFTILGNPRDRWEARLASVDPAPDSVRNDAVLTGASGNASASAASSQTSMNAIYYFGRFDVDNADGKLLTYMTAQIHIVLARATGVLSVPVEAVSPADAAGQRFVEVIGPEGRPERRRVETGLDDQVRIEIRSGLSAGERIIAGRKSAAATPAFRMPPPPPPGM